MDVRVCVYALKFESTKYIFKFLANNLNKYVKIKKMHECNQHSKQHPFVVVMHRFTLCCFVFVMHV